MRNFFYTDGVKYLAETAHAYWLIDLVASAQLEPEVSVHPFQAWMLRVDEDKAEGEIIATDGNDTTIYTQPLFYTDFPLPTVTLFYSDGVLMLPNEY